MAGCLKQVVKYLFSVRVIATEGSCMRGMYVHSLHPGSSGVFSRLHDQAIFSHLNLDRFLSAFPSTLSTFEVLATIKVYFSMSYFLCFLVTQALVIWSWVPETTLP